ncbi:MAG: DUF5753 domain-containing protein [Haloechinothrix sp.]
MAPISPSSSAQAARQAFADRLREIRLDAGLTARALARAAGWHESKCSRVEHARTSPSDADIRAWCETCDATDQIPDLIAASRAAENMYLEWRRVERNGLRQLQESYVPLYQRTRVFRWYHSTLIPGLLQTRDYAHAVLSTIAQFSGIPNDSAEAAEARLARSRVLYEGDHRFAFLVEESVLRYRIASPEVMAAQLGHLLAAMTLPSVSLGVIPFMADRTTLPREGFHMYDDEVVHVELLSAQVAVTAPSEIAEYVKVFQELSEHAVCGAEARKLITAALDALG